MSPESSARRPTPSSSQQLKDRPAAVPVGFTRGFGPILQQEYGLQVVLEEHRAAIQGPRAKDLSRILKHQQQQVSAGIEVLDIVCRELPHAGRFERLDWRHAGREGAPVRQSGDDQLVALAELHRELAANIRTVMEHHLKDRTEPALEAVAQNHEEMAWVLCALSNDGLSAAGGPVRNAARTSEKTGGESRWEDEGGALKAPSAPNPPR